MPSYMVFRAVVPPGFNLEKYAEHSGEPIRYDCVTTVEADNPAEAIHTVIAATGLVSVGMAAVECHLSGFQSKAKFGRGGSLVADENAQNLLEAPKTEREARDRISQLEDEIEELNRIGNSGPTDTP